MISVNKSVLLSLPEENHHQPDKDILRCFTPISSFVAQHEIVDSVTSQTFKHVRKIKSCGK